MPPLQANANGQFVGDAYMRPAERSHYNKFKNPPPLQRWQIKPLHTKVIDMKFNTTYAQAYLTQQEYDAVTYGNALRLLSSNRPQ